MANLTTPVRTPPEGGNALEHEEFDPAHPCYCEDPRFKPKNHAPPAIPNNSAEQHSENHQ